MAEKKAWGRRDFWGVGSEFDARWFLTDSQKDLQKRLIELCRTTLRPNAIISDETYAYPRENLDALAKMRLLGVFVPKELGGMGENHQCAAMVCETIARYGCPSTAMVYVMHLCATSGLCFRYHNNPHIQDLLRRIDDDKLVGTTAFSDPATGGHFWFHMTSKCWKLSEDCYRVLKFATWTTSAGFADWYLFQTVSPGFDGDYSNTTTWLAYDNEVRASTDDWIALGLHGNQSGPLVIEAELKAERMVGPLGDGAIANDETVAAMFFVVCSSVWNGISMGMIDLAKRHVVSKTHGDVGHRVCDYPTIQDYFGDAISTTNAARTMNASYALCLDQASNNCDTSMYADTTVRIRTPHGQWGWQTRYVCAKNVTTVSDAMLHACGGSAYKTELGLERLLRDGKAGHVMSPSNEVLRSMLGKALLMGFESIDFWCDVGDERLLRGEIRKMTREKKRELAHTLLEEADRVEGDDTDKFDFDNPLSGKAPSVVGDVTEGDVIHRAALTTDKFTNAKLAEIKYVTKDKKYALFRFEYEDKTAHSGCLSGQYVELAIPGSKQGRFISPTSDPAQYGSLEAVIRYESHGVLANYLKSLNIGDSVGFRGPCGGLEYSPNTFSHLAFLCGGIGVTPAIQITRSIMNNPDDKTKVTMFYQTRKMDELLFREELDGYAAKSDTFNVVYTLQDMDEAWEGSDGFIDSEFLKKHMPPATTDGSLKVVLCSGGSMAAVCLNALSLLKFQTQDIYIYGPFAAEQLRAVYGRNIRTFRQ